MARYFARVAVYLILLNLIMFVDQILLKVLTAGWYRDHAAALSHAARSGAARGAPARRLRRRAQRAVRRAGRLLPRGAEPGAAVVPGDHRRDVRDLPAGVEVDLRRRPPHHPALHHITMRYSLIFATAIAVVMAANPRPLLDIPYADDYATLGAPALMPRWPWATSPSRCSRSPARS
jgi:hypothetical protein